MDDFFTLTSFTTLGGSVAASVIIINTARHAFNWGPRWFGLVVSVIIAFFAFYLSASLAENPKPVQLDWIKCILILLNGCLIYTSAFGIQNTIITKPDTGISFQGIEEGGMEKQLTKLSLRSPW